MERAALERRARELPEGWRMHIMPTPAMLPIALSGYEPDALATNGEEGIIFEIVLGRENLNRQKIDKIREIREAASSAPGWRVEVLVLPQAGPTLVPVDDVLSRLAEAGRVADISTRAAFALAFSALEWVIGQLAAQGSVEYRPNGQQMAAQLVNLGVLDQEVFQQISRFQALRNAVVHAAMSEDGPSRADVDDLLAITKRLLDATDITV
jgi:hypothetical protein